MTAYCELSLTTGGHRVRIADLSAITLSAFVTDGLYPIVRRLVLDANGYELFNCPTATASEPAILDLPDELQDGVKDAKWFQVVKEFRRELTFSPPALSGRLLPLVRLQR